MSETEKEKTEASCAPSAKVPETQGPHPTMLNPNFALVSSPVDEPSILKCNKCGKVEPHDGMQVYAMSSETGIPEATLRVKVCMGCGYMSTTR
jgi:hypothetical protein